MSNNDNEYKGSTFWQLIIAIPGTILAFTLIISLIAKTFGVAGAPEVAQPAAAVAKVEENIKPAATVEVASADAGPHADKSGEEVYKAVCSMCHAAGLMSAPKFGDKDAWKPRIAQGYETLIDHAIHGIRSMPAKGGNPALTDGEVANAVAHMANASGAKFTPPAAGAAPAAKEAASAVNWPDKLQEKAAAATTSKTKESPASAQPEAKPAAVAAAAPEAKTAAAPAAGKSGEEVYKAVCSMCHAAGLMAAPKFGDKDLWAPRVAQGYDTLVNHAVHGIRNMPAKGGNPGLTDAEVAGAVKYMANSSGASF
ncbi:MAG: cytochrome c5 family protein [Methylotenera sp.]|nr:cytochrome c5 family protein [Methylotenera sp.]